MSGVELSLENAPDFDLDCSALLPEKLLGLPLDAVRRVRLQHGRRRISIGDLFAVSHDDTGALRLRGATARLRRIARDMTSGDIIVHGRAGDELGVGLSGGSVTVRGNVGDFAGSGMRGGVIAIKGDAGDFAGGALPSAALGMRGGVLVISGSAGRQLGARMRRGCIVVDGATGAYAGANMIAGTIVIGGEPGDGSGLGMRRGTLVIFGQRSVVPATFNDCGEFELAAVTLLERYIAQFHRRCAARLRKVRAVRRFVGDIGAGGQGEILLAAD